MIVESITDEQLAVILAHYAYRHTAELAAYRDRVVCMNEDVYAAMHEVVADRLRCVLRNHALLASIEEKDFGEAVDKLRCARAADLLRYARTLDYYLIHPPGEGWEPPRLLSVPRPKDKAAFVLDGCFRRFCTEHRRLDSAALLCCDRDVLDRMYTLIKLKVLPYRNYRKNQD